MDDIDITLEDLDINIKPTLYDINKSFSVVKTQNYNGIVGEEEARMVIFTNFILGEKPVILKGSRSSGKSNLLKIVGVYSKNPIDIASSSDKAYQRNKALNDYSHFFIPEVNKINDKTVEMLKDFGEGEKHQYSFTNPFKEVETITIDPKPFITSIADENKNVDALGEELLSRLTVVRTDSSVKQNINVIEEKLKRAQNPNYKQNVTQEEVNKLKNYVKSLPSIREFGFIYPAGASVRSAIPPLFTDSRRDTEKYLSNTYGITLFHLWDRMEVYVGDKKYLLVTPADIWYNHRIYQNVLLESSLKCGKIEQRILEVLKDHGDVEQTDNWGNKVTGLSVTDIHTELLRLSFTPTIESVKKMCNQLMEIGYVTRNEEVRPHRFSLNPELKREHKVMIDWNNIINECKKSIQENFPSLSEEYISRYCSGDGLIVIDPFTGEKKNILSGDKIDDKVEEYKKQNEELKKKVKVDKKPDVQIDISIDDDTLGEVDNSDMLEDAVRMILTKRNKTMSIEEIKEEVEETVIMKTVKDDNLLNTLNYLIKIGDAFIEKPGFYRCLK